MKSKTKILIITNILFYFFVIFHRVILIKYGDDYLISVFFYMALSFSTLVMEEAFRKGIKELKFISVADFIIRVTALIVHLLYLIFSLNIFTVNFITGMLFVLNVIVQFVIFKKSKVFPVEKQPIVADTEIKEFIESYYSKKMDKFKIGVDLSRELLETMATIQISGRGNLIAICLFAATFISSFIYNNFKRYILIAVIVVSILGSIFIKLNTDFIRIGFKDEEDIDKKILIENLGFVVGYVILFLVEVVLQPQLGYLRVSLWQVSCLAFVPILNSKYKVKERLKMQYLRYRESQ